MQRRRDNRWFTVANVTPAILMLAVACVTSASAPAAAGDKVGWNHRNNKQGKIVGHLYLAGGPHFLQKRHPKGLPGSYLKVLITDRSGSTVSTSKLIATTTTKRDGSFALTVVAGSYRIAGQLATGQLCLAQSIVVRSGRQTRVAIYCSIK
jgi:hypothetical protein